MPPLVPAERENMRTTSDIALGRRPARHRMGHTYAGYTGEMTTPDAPAPEPQIDPPEQPHPDQQDTISPGLNDESISLPREPEPATPESDGAATDVATEEPSG